MIGAALRPQYLHTHRCKHALNLNGVLGRARLCHPVLCKYTHGDGGSKKIKINIKVFDYFIENVFGFVFLVDGQSTAGTRNQTSVTRSKHPLQPQPLRLPLPSLFLLLPLPPQRLKSHDCRSASTRVHVVR